MSQVNEIGLNSTKSEDNIKSMNTLLSSYQIQYMNARGFHWNIKGRNFFELHLKFEEIYNLLLLKVDEIAERILTLDGAPLHAFSDYLEVSEIKEAKIELTEDLNSLKESVKIKDDEIERLNQEISNLQTLVQIESLKTELANLKMLASKSKK